MAATEKDKEDARAFAAGQLSQKSDDAHAEARDLARGAIRDTSGPVAKYEPGSAAQMAAEAGIPLRTMGDAGGMYAGPEKAPARAPVNPGGGTVYDFDPSGAPVARPDPPPPGAAPPPEPPPATGGPLPPAPPQAPAGYFRKGLGYVPESRSIQEGIKGPDVDDARAQYGAAAGLGLESTDHAAAAEMARNHAADQIAKTQYQAEAQTQARLAELQERKSKASEDAIRHMTELSQQIQDGAIDPNHIWKERGTGARILASIGIALGAAAATATGGQNHVLAQVNAEIDRDIDAQKANLQGKARGLEAAKSLYAMNLDHFGDEERAILATRAAGKEQAAREFDVLTAGSKDQDTIARAAKGKAAILGSAADDKMKLAQLSGDRVATHEGFDRGGWVGGTGGAAVSHTVTLPDGRTVAFQTEDDRKKVQERLLASQDLANIYARVQTLRSELTPGYIAAHPIDARTKYHELDSMAERALPAWSIANGQGQVKEEEAKRYKESLFPFSSMWDPAADTIIAAGVKENGQKVDNIVKTHGGEYVAPGYTVGPNGLRPSAEYLGDRAKPAALGMPKGAKKMEGT